MRIRSIVLMGVIACSMLFLLDLSKGNAATQGSKHDFSILGTSGFSGNFAGDNDESCVYCHTPHGASTVANMKPLWNRTNATTTFTPYTSTTMDAITPVSISPVSLLCLSCHDGVGAINSVLNSPGSGSPAMIASGFDQIGDLGPLGKFINIGGLSAVGPMDLTDDHPVSIIWPAGDAGLNPMAGIDSRLKLRGGNMVECTTCHDPHNQAAGIALGEVQFLVMSNVGSAMCVSCHNK